MTLLPTYARNLPLCEVDAMTVKITTLIENSPGEHKALVSEHGLSFYIEKDGHCLMFDTGQSGAFLKNCEQLLLDPTNVEYVVLSHGHYDHSGGLRPLAEVTTDFNLVLGQGFFGKKYGDNTNSREYLGNNFDQHFLDDKEIAYTFAEEDVTEIISGIYVIANFPRTHEDEIINSRFTLFREGAFQPDPFDDEIALAIDSPHGLILILGCSHPGMKNMVDHTVELLGKPIYAILGGTHLVESDQQSMGLSLDYLNKNILEIIGVSHCTGKPAMGRLEATTSQYYQNRTGSSLFIP